MGGVTACPEARAARPCALPAGAAGTADAWLQASRSMPTQIQTAVLASHAGPAL